MAFSVTHIEAERVLTNQRANSEHHLENRSKVKGVKHNLPGSQITLITCKLSVQVSNGGRILFSHGICLSLVFENSPWTFLWNSCILEAPIPSYNWFQNFNNRWSKDLARSGRSTVNSIRMALMMSENLSCVFVTLIWSSSSVSDWCNVLILSPGQFSFPKYEASSKVKFWNPRSCDSVRVPMTSGWWSRKNWRALVPHFFWPDIIKSGNR